MAQAEVDIGSRVALHAAPLMPPQAPLWGHCRGHQWSAVVEVLEICACMYVATQLQFYT